MTTTPWEPYREPLRATLMRTILIALVGGIVIALTSHGRIPWTTAALLLLWFSFGGHWVELWFLNWLRPRVSSARAVQITARVATWFVGGSVLALGMGLTAQALGGIQLPRWASWWLGGALFIGVELIVHVGAQLRGKPSFYNGRG